MALGLRKASGPASLGRAWKLPLNARRISGGAVRRLERDAHLARQMSVLVGSFPVLLFGRVAWIRVGFGPRCHLALKGASAISSVRRLAWSLLI